MVAGQHFGLQAKLRHEFRGRAEGGVVQSSYLFYRYSTRIVEQRLARHKQAAKLRRNQRAGVRISNLRIFP